MQEDGTLAMRAQASKQPRLADAVAAPRRLHLLLAHPVISGLHVHLALLPGRRAQQRHVAQHARHRVLCRAQALHTQCRSQYGALRACDMRAISNPAPGALKLPSGAWRRKRATMRARAARARRQDPIGRAREGSGWGSAHYTPRCAHEAPC